MSKVYVVFQKSDDSMGTFTEPIKVFSTEKMANKWANARALSTNISYTIGSYELSDDEEIEIPKQVKIESLYNQETKQLISINSISPETDLKLSNSTRTDFFNNEKWNDLCTIVTYMSTAESDNAYEDTLRKYKEIIKDLSPN